MDTLSGATLPETVRATLAARIASPRDRHEPKAFRRPVPVGPPDAKGNA